MTGSSEAGPEPAEQAARINITAAMQAGWVLRSGCTRCERPAKGETSSIVTRPASAPLAPRKPSAQSQAAPLLPRSKPEDEHCDRCQAVLRKAKPQVHFPGLARLLRTAAIVARKKRRTDMAGGVKDYAVKPSALNTVRGPTAHAKNANAMTRMPTGRKPYQLTSKPSDAPVAPGSEMNCAE